MCPIPTNEGERLQALRRYNVLDTSPEPIFDNIAQLAALACDTPTALLTLVDDKRQWFKAKIGFAKEETAREIAFCAYTISGNEVFEVEDALQDERFCDNPFVLGEPPVRFYAGVPIITREGYAIGTVAVLDRVPRKLTSRQREILKQLATQAMAQLELRLESWETRERLRAFVTASPLPLFVVDPSARIQFWNPAAERLFGWSADEVLGKVNPTVLPEDEQTYRGLLKSLATAKKGITLEVKRKARDGTVLDVNLSLAPIHAESGGAPAVVSILVDITDRKRSERELRQTVSLLSATLESTTDGILVVDRNGVVVAHNKKFAELWHIPEDAISNRKDAELLEYALDQLPDRAGFLRVLNDLYSHPEQESFDRIELKDGRIFERYSQPQCIENEIVGRVWSFRDVTARAELEERVRQTQKMEAIGALAGGIAHDFNNLLNVIIGYTSLLASGLKPGDEASLYAANVRSAADRAAALTRQLLAFSRRQVLHPQVLDVNELVHGLARLLPRIIPENIDFRVTLSNETLRIKADAGQIEQVLMNIVVNARDAMPGGGVLELRTRRAANSDESAGDLVIISVRDTGAGIEPSILPRIFEPFFTTKPVGKGTGLGLSTAYGIVRQSGGQIRIETEPGHGTTFNIELPVTSELPEEKAIAGAAVKNSGQTGNILIVEDNAELRTLTARILRQAGYNVTEALSPEQAIQLLTHGDLAIDVLLTDVVMPHMSGPELAKKAQKLHPGISITFMSGYFEDNVLECCEKASILEKPFSPTTLLEHIHSLMAMRERPAA